MSTVEKIHAEIDSAQERLIQQAKEILSQNEVKVESNEEKLLNKAERLAKLGFTSSKEVTIASKIKERIEAKKTIIVQTQKQAEDLEYFHKTYPFSKILTVDELDRICDKYDLIYAPVANYTMDIPEKNLQDIENCKKLDELDSPTIFYKILDVDGKEDFKKFCKILNLNPNYISNAQVRQIHINYKGYCPEGWLFGENSDHMVFVHAKEALKLDFRIREYARENREGLFIAAPKSHFNLEELDNEENQKGWFKVIKSESKDPIVFEFCRDNIVRVITKWGLEGEDPDLQVPILN